MKPCPQPIRWCLALVVLSAAGLSCSADATSSPADSDSSGLKVGSSAPDFSSIDGSHKTVKLSDFSGHIVVLDFWATWCGPCQASLPHTEKVAEESKGKGIVVLATCTSDTRANFETWLRTNQERYPAITFTHDPAESGPELVSSKLYGVEGIPTQFVIGPDGKVIAVIVGFDQNDSRLEDVLAHTGPAKPPAKTS